MADNVNPLGVPAHRHANGGGWVADSARVADRVYVGPDARVYRGTIGGGTIEGGTIWGGTIWGGTIWGGTIWGGTIRGGTIGGGTIESTRHVLVVGPVGSEDQWVTLTRTDTGHRVTIGCWNGENTIADLMPEVQRRCPDRVDEYAEILPVLARRVAEWETEREASRG